MNTELREKFGYPVKCELCSEFDNKPRNIEKIDPYFQKGDKIKLLLIGQDPTIFDKPERVNTVLMLNEKKGRNGQLRKWLEKELFGEENFKKIELYATNLVKCQFGNPPTASQEGALKFLKPRFEKCKKYLFKEIEKFKPMIVLTLGESAHKLFAKELEIIDGQISFKMKEDFKGEFYNARLKNITFEYSPCLHIKTFRVAETYGRQVFDFKKKLLERIE